MAEREAIEEKDTPPASEHAAAPTHHHSGAPHGDHGEEPHEGAPEWLISFADNVMLQMGFFVILLALAMKGASAGGLAKDGKQRSGGGSPTPDQLDFAIAVREAFNNPVDINSKDLNDLLLVRRLRERAGASDTTDEGLRGNDHDVHSIRHAQAYGTGGSIAFDTRSDTLDDAGKSAADQLGAQFRGCQTVLEIRGHCSAAEAYGRDDRGMELSYQRALAVARELVAQGLSWSQLRVTGCADADRVTETTYDEAGHRSNQRVEVIQIDQAAETEDGGSNTTTPSP
jgi:outer membrane protein OmpA-like peptidoglycan-associated protein